MALSDLDISDDIEETISLLKFPIKRVDINRYMRESVESEIKRLGLLQKLMYKTVWKKEGEHVQLEVFGVFPDKKLVIDICFVSKAKNNSVTWRLIENDESVSPTVKSDTVVYCVSKSSSLLMGISTNLDDMMLSFSERVFKEFKVHLRNFKDRHSHRFKNGEYLLENEEHLDDYNSVIRKIDDWFSENRPYSEVSDLIENFATIVTDDI